MKKKLTPTELEELTNKRIKELNLLLKKQHYKVKNVDKLFILISYWNILEKQSGEKLSNEEKLYMYKKFNYINEYEAIK